MGQFFIKTTPAFERCAKKLLSNQSIERLYDELEAQPEKGEIIRGTGGVRKLRWATGKNNKGKSGGVRVLYHYSKGLLVLLITLYEKSDKDNISKAERNQLKKEIPKLVAKYCEDLK